VTLPLAALLASFAAAAALRPVDALLVLAAFLPISRTVSSAFGLPLAVTEPLILCWLAGTAVAAVAGRVPFRMPRRRLAPAAALFAAVVATSLSVSLAVLAMTTDDPAARLWTFVTQQYFRDPKGIPAVGASLLLLEGVALVIATCVSVQGRTAWNRVAAMFALGGVAAALLNVYRLFEIALRHGFGWSEIAGLSQQARINIHYADVNAAGSYFVLVLPLTLGLARGGSAPARAWYAGAVVLGTALWLTGSRAALAAATIVALAPVAGALARTGGRARRVPALAGVAAVLIVVLASAAQIERLRPDTASAAAGIRWEMAKVTWQMLRTRPVFGIGPGEFYGRSTEFASPELRAQYARENAHNNFFQVLAELGLLGSIAFVWLLLEAAGPRRVRPASHARDPAVRALTLGVLAFLITCLAGHPLLVPDVAYPFWIALGIVAAAPATAGEAERLDAPGRAGAVTHRRDVRWAGAVAAMLVISVPFRAVHERRLADLAGAAFGVSDWYADPDGRLVRDVRGAATVFVPGGSRLVVVPLRWTGAEPIMVGFRFDGRDADRIRLEPNRWHDVRFVVPPSASSRSRRLDVVADGPATGGRVKMGRILYRLPAPAEHVPASSPERRPPD
jgi:O-antigen ligase